MISCTKRIEFDSAHRVPSHSGACKMLHGHRYVLEVSFVTKNIDDSGMIIDFGIIKTRLKQWLDENWDHNTILSQSDKKLGDDIAAYTGQKPFYLINPPTAENMADFLYKNVIPELFNDFSDLKCVKLRLYETPNSYAECAAY